ncbi:MAG: hypothetical protein A2V72_02115 [Candidatus Nealsonbacteria bacterium RBG_13_37_56]|uniref:Uncharacterized protein n=1 Tax=Candidatus Nealsonbacteria bacterium RBG_13_37_56 TaxID=1801661 RepID=A0A1G2DXT4_9BACT|nr:MAG: hypothetical protein A2V72_02115 [Candidatus Nealsonbacteria bacterium RBG_13_37_56]
MSQQIHARTTEEGMRFRIWSTSDSYVTDEMTEKELREYTLLDAVTETIRQHLREIDDRIQRTCEKGTSLLGDTRELNGPWDEERE